ncbi:hypothetical protein, partial [Streptomyces sp. e14]|uniref:hypothetical protein n=1 Tax=Streptomyces sp. e14 TaxID=645465 RepID=UPI001E35CBED
MQPGGQQLPHVERESGRVATSTGRCAHCPAGAFRHRRYGDPHGARGARAAAWDGGAEAATR